MKEKKSSPGGAGKNINSINFIKRLFGTEKCARTTEIELVGYPAKTACALRQRETGKRQHKFTKPMQERRLMSIDISRVKISIAVLVQIYTASAPLGMCALSGEGVPALHSVLATRLVSRHRLEFWAGGRTARNLRGSRKLANWLCVASEAVRGSAEGSRGFGGEPAGSGTARDGGWQLLGSSFGKLLASCRIVARELPDGGS